MSTELGGPQSDRRLPLDERCAEAVHARALARAPGVRTRCPGAPLGDPVGRLSPNAELISCNRFLLWDQYLVHPRTSRLDREAARGTRLPLTVYEYVALKPIGGPKMTP